VTLESLLLFESLIQLTSGGTGAPRSQVPHFAYCISLRRTTLLWYFVCSLQRLLPLILATTRSTSFSCSLFNVKVYEAKDCHKMGCMIAYGGSAEAEACKMIKHPKRDIAVPKPRYQTPISGNPLLKVVNFRSQPTTRNSKVARS